MTECKPMNDEVLLVTRPVTGVCMIRLNRPEVRNALNVELRGRLGDVLLEVQRDIAVRCVVIGGSDVAFCRGRLKRLRGCNHARNRGKKNGANLGSFANVSGSRDCRRESFALGGGCEIALAADIVIAGKNATFGQPEILVGLMPGGGATQRMVRVVGKARTMDLMLTGRRFSASEALEMGIVAGSWRTRAWSLKPWNLHCRLQEAHPWRLA